MKKIIEFFRWPLKDLLHEIKRTVLAIIVVLVVATILIGIDVNGLLFGTSDLAVATEPGGANIFIDGKLKGESPARKGYGRKIQVFAGSHTVEALIPSTGPREKYGRQENVVVAKEDMELVTLELQERINLDYMEKFHVKYGGGIPKPVMVAIPGGSFIMGQWDGSKSIDVTPPHKVTISPFMLGATEVTFEQYDACVATGGCDYYPADEGDGRGNRPVINVNWDDTQQYIEWLNQRTGQSYRLPTEAEWEYAARAGSTSKYSWGDEIGENMANCAGCGSQSYADQTLPVGSFAANAFGLYDMLGNVGEWCQDWHTYEPHYFNRPVTDPQGPASGSRRVNRGGCWVTYWGRLSPAVRSKSRPEWRSSVDGFRLVLPANK